MRLTSVVLSTSTDHEELVFSVRKPAANARYIIRGMVGIDGENIIPKFIGFGLVSGEPLYEYTMNTREIVMRLTLLPRFSVNERVSDIRDPIYRAISATRTGKLELKFMDGPSVVSFLKGKITSMEVVYFDKEPQVQLTIECDDPIFRSIVPIELTETELGDAIPVTIADESSTAPHGFEFTVKFTGTTSTFVVQDKLSTPDWKFQITPASSFLVNDELTISSEYGQKRAYLNRAIGTDLDVMDKVLAGSIWPQIFAPETTLYFPQRANFDWLSFKFRSAYWGL